MIKVAITGNIASGKSTACKVFETLGVPVFYADWEARQLYQNKLIQQQVKRAFGENIFDHNNQLNRVKLASIVFNDAQALQTINDIIHPNLMKRYFEWLKDHEKSIYTLHEAAVIFENGLQKYFDKVINVSAPLELRILRIMKRDGLSLQAIRNRIQMQWSDEKKNKMSDFIIYSDNKQFMIPQVMNIHQKLIQK